MKQRVCLRIILATQTCLRSVRRPPSDVTSSKHSECDKARNRQYRVCSGTPRSSFATTDINRFEIYGGASVKHAHHCALSFFFPTKFRTTYLSLFPMSKSMKVCATFSLSCHTNIATVGNAVSHFSRPFELHLSTQIKYELRHTRKKRSHLARS